MLRNVEKRGVHAPRNGPSRRPPLPGARWPSRRLARRVALVQFKGRVEPGRAPAGEGRKPVGCVELAMTHLSASRCVIATHFLLVPGKRGLPPTFPWNLFSRPTPFAVGRKLAWFSCSIPPLFVLSHNISMINTTSNWLCFGAFLRGQQSQRDNAPTPLLDSMAMGTGAMLTRRVSWRALALHYPRGILGRHDRCGTPCSRQREHATQRKPWPTQSHLARLASAGRVRRACDDAPLSVPVRLCDAPYLGCPGNVVCPQRSPGTCSPAPRRRPEIEAMRGR